MAGKNGNGNNGDAGEGNMLVLYVSLQPMKYGEATDHEILASVQLRSGLNHETVPWYKSNLTTQAASIIGHYEMRAWAANDRIARDGMAAFNQYHSSMDTVDLGRANLEEAEAAVSFLKRVDAGLSKIAKSDGEPLDVAQRILRLAKVLGCMHIVMPNPPRTRAISGIAEIMFSPVDGAAELRRHVFYLQDKLQTAQGVKVA